MWSSQWQFNQVFACQNAKMRKATLQTAIPNFVQITDAPRFLIPWMSMFWPKKQLHNFAFFHFSSMHECSEPKFDWFTNLLRLICSLIHPLLVKSHINPLKFNPKIGLFLFSCWFCSPKPEIESSDSFDKICANCILFWFSHHNSPLLLDCHQMCEDQTESYVSLICFSKWVGQPQLLILWLMENNCTEKEKNNRVKWQEMNLVETTSNVCKSTFLFAKNRIWAKFNCAAGSHKNENQMRERDKKDFAVPSDLMVNTWMNQWITLLNDKKTSRMNKRRQYFSVKRND